MKSHPTPNREPDIILLDMTDEDNNTTESLSVWVVNESNGILSVLYNWPSRDEGTSEVKYSKDGISYRHDKEDSFTALDLNDKENDEARTLVNYLENYKKELEQSILGEDNE